MEGDFKYKQTKRSQNNYHPMENPFTRIQTQRSSYYKDSNRTLSFNTLTLHNKRRLLDLRTLRQTTDYQTHHTRMLQIQQLQTNPWKLINDVTSTRISKLQNIYKFFTNIDVAKLQ